MNFSDNKIRIVIRDLNAKTTGTDADTSIDKSLTTFKAYLEKSDLQVKFVDETIKYTPLGYSNNTQLMKTNYNMDFSFNLFSENETEAAENYFNVMKLLFLLRPKYQLKNNQYIPDAKNLFGLISLKYDGMIPLRYNGNNEMRMYVTNFSYQINKDLGYASIDSDKLSSVMQDFSSETLTTIRKKGDKIDSSVLGDFIQTAEIKYSKDLTADKSAAAKTTVNFSDVTIETKRVIIPIGYKIDISGKILLSLSDSLDRFSYSGRRDPETNQEIIGTREQSILETLKKINDGKGWKSGRFSKMTPADLIELTKKLYLEGGFSDDDWENLSEEKKGIATGNISDAIKSGIINDKGEVVVPENFKNFRPFPSYDIRLQFKQLYKQANLTGEKLLTSTTAEFQIPDSLKTKTDEYGKAIIGIVTGKNLLYDEEPLKERASP